MNTPHHVHNPTSPCSCTIQHTWEAESIAYCPAHAAAPALVAALEGLLELEGRYTRVGLRQFDSARALLRAVEGK